MPGVRRGLLLRLQLQERAPPMLTAVITPARRFARRLFSPSQGPERPEEQPDSQADQPDRQEDNQTEPPAEPADPEVAALRQEVAAMTSQFRATQEALNNLTALMAGRAAQDDAEQPEPADALLSQLNVSVQNSTEKA